MLGWLRRRRLSEASRRKLMIALARAEEQLLETHVRNALAVCEAVADDVPVRRALRMYLEAVRAGEPQASMIGRRVLARLEGGASRGARTASGPGEREARGGTGRGAETADPDRST